MRSRLDLDQQAGAGPTEGLTLIVRRGTMIFPSMTLVK
jgi:hypothetical protein